MNILNQFWGLRDIYEPTAMLASKHMILLILSLIVLSGLIYISRGITNEQIRKLTLF